VRQDNQIRVVLLDDHGLFRAILARFLASEPDVEIVSECDTSSEALETLSGSIVDVVLLDFDLGSERGSDFITAARKAGYRGHFLIVASAPDVNSAVGLKLGASGVFLKSEAPDRLLRAIRLVADGDIWVDHRVIQMLADQVVTREPQSNGAGLNGALEEREHQVLRGILAGLTNKKIGDTLGLTESSVKNVVQRLFGKAGVKKRSQLVRVALEGSRGLSPATRNTDNRKNNPSDLKVIA